jgi:hypothetical protein
MSLQDDVQAAVAAVNQVEQDVNSVEPTFADQVLAAVQPVFEAAGWTAPAPSTTDAGTTTEPELPANS